MDVFADFLEVFPLVELAIGTAEFLAIDAELTGLTSDTPPRDAFCEDPQERYARLSHSDFLIVQFGLTCFQRKNEGEGGGSSYVARPFNFWLFPRQLTRESPDPRFTCQASSLRFLSGVKFDFNKLFRDGLSFANRERAEAERRRLQERREKNARDHIALDTDADKAFLAESIAKVGAWIGEKPDEAELKLPPCNAFLRLVLFQEIPRAFPDVVVETEPGVGTARAVIVKRASAEERAEAERKKQQAQYDEFQLYLGFTKVLEAITASRKPVVGHNMILDLINSVGQFAGPLPALLSEFKAKCAAIFPRVFDTKYIVTVEDEVHGLFHDTALETLDKRFREPPFSPPKIELASGFEKRYADQEKFHEAGYDSFVTGRVFASLCSFIVSKSGGDLSASIFDSPAILRLENRLGITRSDYPFINLAGEDPIPSRDHVFHISGFAASWKTNNIKAAFSDFGDVQVRWVDDTSAFIIADPAKAGDILAAFAKQQAAAEAGEAPLQFVLTTFAAYKSDRGILTPPR